MGKIGKYHHLIPRVYMKAWRHGDLSIYVVEKGKSDLGTEKNMRNFGGINNYHSIRAGSLYASSDDCADFFKPLQNYSVEIDGEIVEDLYDLNMKFVEFDEWIIKDSNGKEVTKKVKNTLKNTIRSITKKDIEVGWDKQYENHWDKINKQITHDILLKANSLTEKHLMKETIDRKDLIKFMVSIEWRTNLYHPEIQETLDKALRKNSYGIDFKSILIPEKERLYPFLETLYDEYAHSIILKFYREFLDGTGPIMEEAQKLINTAGIVFRLAPKDGEFITSDNPVCRFTNTEGKPEIIFPLTPKIACSIYLDSAPGYYVLDDINKDELVRYNNTLKDNCKEGYIIREQNRKLYFGDEK
ncbi:DUF4238 domain-containing protein [Bacillus toyonensis]